MISFLFLFLFYLFIYLFMAALGLRCCTQVFFSYVKRGLFLLRSTGSKRMGFSSCGTRA